MFKNTFQSGFLSILYSIGSKPLQIWDKQVRNGHIKRITDQVRTEDPLSRAGTARGPRRKILSIADTAGGAEAPPPAPGRPSGRTTVGFKQHVPAGPPPPPRCPGRGR